MHQFFNTTIGTLVVACLALFSLPASNPEPSKSSQSSLSAPAPDMSAMQRTLDSILSKIDRQTVASSDKFDSGGSDGVTDSPSWPTPSANQPRQPVAPDVSGSGSNGSGPAGYSSAPVMYYYSSPVAVGAVSAFGDGSGSTGGFSRSMSVASYRDSFGSDGGGYSTVRTRSVQGTGLLGRVRARTGGLAPIRRSVSSGMNCVDGVCYPN